MSNILFGWKFKNRKEILRNLKIKYRLILAFGGLLSITILIIGLSSYLISKASMESKISTFSSEVIGQIGTNIDEKMNKTQEIIQQISFDTEVQNFFNTEKFGSDYDELSKVQYLSKMLANRSLSAKDVNGVCIVSSDNSVILGNKSANETDEVIKNLKNISEKASTGVVWSQQDIAKNKRIFISQQVKSIDLGNSYGTIFAEVDPTNLSSAFKNVNLGDNSDIVILNSEGLIVSSKNSDKLGIQYDAKITETLKNLKKSKKQKSNNFFKTQDGKYIISYSELQVEGWYVVGAIPMSFIDAASNNLRVSVGIIGITAFIISMLAALIIARSISNPLGNLVKLMNKAKDGDLSIHIEDNCKDEIGEVINAFDQMVKKINGLIAEVKVLTKSVYDSIRVITKISEHSYASSEEIAATMSEIATGAIDQANSVSQGMNHMSNLADGINIVNERMDNVSSILETTQMIKEEALLSVKTLKEKAQETSKASNKIVEETNSLNSKMKEIKGIVSLIVGIAEQTNLLSLNAAIEAARAGESGRGFAVVAEEVRKLADKSKEESTQINNIINTIQKQTETTANEANSTSLLMHQQMEAVTKADSAFNVIFDSMNSISACLSNVIASVNEIVVAKENTTAAIENITAISEETSAITQQVSASTEEQLEGTQRVARSAEDLSTLIVKLNSALELFRI